MIFQSLCYFSNTGVEACAYKAWGHYISMAVKAQATGCCQELGELHAGACSFPGRYCALPMALSFWGPSNSILALVAPPSTALAVTPCEGFIPGSSFCLDSQQIEAFFQMQFYGSCIWQNKHHVDTITSYCLHARAQRLQLQLHFSHSWNAGIKSIEHTVSSVLKTLTF